MLSACATAHHTSQQKDVYMIPDVPFYPQEEYQCGPASLASVLGYWGAGADQDDIAREIFSRSARGTLTIDMILYAKRKGFHAEQFKGSMEKLRGSLDAGYPLIVLVDYGVSVIQINHFMVVTGYTNDGVIVHSGKTPNKFLHEKDFLSSWKKTGYWTLLIRRP
jgi:ABC-type bacteriocin/lantibiotic exporter with double-glycine peptidase domain